MASEGFLHYGNGLRVGVGFKFILSVDHRTGGGFIHGRPKLENRVKETTLARLEISPKQYLSVLLGKRHDGLVPVVILPPGFAENLSS